jgi:hypothetical protein
LHLALALVLGAALASGLMHVMTGAPQRAARGAQPAKPVQPPAQTAAVAEQAVPAAAKAAPTTQPEPPFASVPAWTPSSAAAALARDEYELALRGYRALAQLHPHLPVYDLIADVLARKLVQRCGEGAPCRPLR